MRTRFLSPIRMSWLIVSLGLRWCLGPDDFGQAQEVPKYARDLPSVRTGEPIFQFNGKDLTGFYTYLHDHQVRRPGQGLHGPRWHDPHFGRRIRRPDDQGRVPRLSPGRGMEVGRANLGTSEAERARLGHPAPLCRPRRRGRRQLDGVAGMPDHRRRLRRLAHGRRS